MKLAFLAGANSIHSVRWVKFFAERNYQIVWISFAPPISEAKELIKRVNFYEIKPSPLSDINGLLAFCYLPVALWQLRQILKKEKPSLLHVHSAGTYGLAGTLAYFHPLILTPWGTDILLTPALKKPLVKLIIKNADFYTCDGQNTFQKLIEIGAQPEKIHIIHFGTDIEKFKPKPKLKIENYKLKIISLRSLEPVYDIETLIKAAAIIIKEYPNTEFLLAGDGNERSKLERLVDKMKLKKNLKFLGRINNEQLPPLLQSADIYVSTSLSDSGLSASTAEAMAAGLPVVVTDTGDNKDWVDNDFVIPVKSPGTLAEKIIALIKDERLKENQGVRNRQIIEQKNNYRTEMEKMEKLYEKVIASY